MPAKKFPKKIINTILGKTKRRKRKKTKKPKRKKPTYKNTRRSTSGKIVLPIDVTSPADIPTFLKALKSKNVTVILIYADWCPHCHTIMPHFDAASKSPNSTVASVKIKETMLSHVNDAITTNVNRSAKPIKVYGYPSIIMVNKNAEKITSINPVNDTKTLTSVMDNAGPLAQEALQKENGNSINSANNGNNENNENKNNKNGKNGNSINSANNGNNENNENKNNKNGKNGNSINSANNGNNNNKNNNNKNNKNSVNSVNNVNNVNSVKSVNNKNKPTNVTNNLSVGLANQYIGTKKTELEEPELEEPELIFNKNNKKSATNSEYFESPIGSSNVGTSEINETNTVIPPVLELNETLRKKNQLGGSLMSAMARSTYTLAPTAALLAAASSFIKTKKRKKR